SERWSGTPRRPLPSCSAVCTCSPRYSAARFPPCGLTCRSRSSGSRSPPCTSRATRYRPGRASWCSPVTPPWHWRRAAGGSCTATRDPSAGRESQTSTIAAEGRAMRSVLGAVADRRTWYGLVYLLVAAPLGFAGFVFVGFSFFFGVVLALTFVGLPLLAASSRVVRAFGVLDRELARGLLDEQVNPPRPFVAGRGLLGWLQAALRDPVAWRARLYLV